MAWVKLRKNRNQLLVLVRNKHQWFIEELGTSIKITKRRFWSFVKTKQSGKPAGVKWTTVQLMHLKHKLNYLTVNLR